MKIYNSYQNRIFFRQNIKPIKKDEQKKSSKKELLTSKTAISCYCILAILGWYLHHGKVHATGKQGKKEVKKTSTIKNALGEIIDSLL